MLRRIAGLCSAWARSLLAAAGDGGKDDDNAESSVQPAGSEETASAAADAPASKDASAEPEGMTQGICGQHSVMLHLENVSEE